MSDDLVKRLRNTPNWMREEYGGYKDGVKQYDRSPFEAADRIKELEAKLSKSEALLAKAVTRMQHIAANKTTDELTRIEWDTHDTYAVLDACILSARTTLAELKEEDRG